MPITPPRRPNPKDPTSFHAVDRRIHPQDGVLYRVLDPKWTKLYGRDLEWKDAKALKTSIANKRISSTVMIEAEDVPIPAGLREAAEAATREFVAAIGAAAPSSSPAQGAPLGAIHAKVLSVAGAAAREANDRAEAAARREKYRLEQQQSQRETDELAKKAGNLAGGDDVGDAEIDDFLAGTGGMPTDEEIRKAKEAAAKGTTAPK